MKNTETIQNLRTQISNLELMKADNSPLSANYSNELFLYICDRFTSLNRQLKDAILINPNK